MLKAFRLRLHPLVLHGIILAAISLPYVIGLGESSLWDSNEAFYAETPREMLITGNYLAPQFNFQPRTQKPPLTYWAILLSYKLFGINEFGVRIPGALAAMGTFLFTYGLGNLLFNPRAALIAALITATTPRIFILARRLPIDILLLFWMTGTLFFILRALRNNNSFNWGAAFLFAGLGFLTKGPIAVVIPAGVLILCAIIWRRPPLSSISLLVGMFVFLIVVLPWYAWAYHAHGWTYIAPFFLRDNIGRFASEPLGPARGPLYYFPVYIVDFFPWSLLSLPSFYLWYRNRKAERSAQNASLGLLFVWCALLFLLFSISKNKQEYYIAPIYPVAALLVAGMLDKTLLQKRESKAGRSAQRDFLDPAMYRARAVWLWVHVVCFIIFLILAVFSVYVIPRFLPGAHRVLHYAPSVIFAVAGILTGWNLVSGKIARCIPVLSTAVGTLYLLCAGLYLPAIEPLRPVKHFCRIIESHSHNEDEVGYYKTAFPSMVYYLRRPIFEENDPNRMRMRFTSGRRVFCILAESDYNFFTGDGNLTLYVLDRRPHFSMRLRTLLDSSSAADELLVVSNQPHPEAESRKGRPIL